MMNDGYSLADLAAVNNEGFGGYGAWWIIILFLFAFMNGGFGFNNVGDFGQYATAASQQQILFGQEFQNLYDKIDRTSNGVCDSTFALNSAIKDAQSSLGTAIAGEGRALQQQVSNSTCDITRNIDSVRYDMANYNAGILATIKEDGEATRKMMYENKIENLQSQINQLQLQNAMCGEVKYPSSTTYAMNNPFCGCAQGQF